MLPAKSPAMSPAIGAKIDPRKNHAFLVRNQKPNRGHLTIFTSSVLIIWSSGFALALTGNSLLFPPLLLSSPPPLSISSYLFHNQIVPLRGGRRRAPLRSNATRHRKCIIPPSPSFLLPPLLFSHPNPLLLYIYGIDFDFYIILLLYCI